MNTALDKKDIITSQGDKAFSDVAQGARNFAKSLEEVNEELIKTHKNLEKVTEEEVKGINATLKLEKARQESNKTVKTAIQNDIERVKLKQQINRLEVQEAKEQERLLKNRKREEQQLKKTNSLYLKFRKEVRDSKNEAKELNTQMVLLARSGKQNTKEYRALESQYNKTAKEANKLHHELDKIDTSLNDFQGRVGNYERATNGLQSGLLQLAGAFGIGALVNSFADLSLELSKAENKASTFFDTTEEGIKEISKEASILAKVYNKDVNEVLRTANVLSKEYGVTGQEALRLVNEGFERGGDVSNELLSNIEEYATQLRLAGLNAEQSIAIITESQQAGVFSDKGIDAIKEATISLREMTPATKEALQAIGVSAEQVQKDIQSGAKSYFDVIQEISATTRGFGEQSQQAGQILADVFRGAGEDAGKFIFELDKLSVNLEELEKQNKGYEGSIQNLTKSWYEYIYGVEEGLGIFDKFSGVINFTAQNLPEIINLILKAGKYFLLWRVQVALLGKDLTKLNLGNLLKSLRNLPRTLRGVIKGFKAGSISAKTFGTALKSIPLFAVIGLVTELVSWIITWGDATEEQTQKESDLNDQLERGNKARELRVQAETDIISRVKQLNLLSKQQTKDLIDDIKNQINTYTELQSKIDKVRLTRQQEQNELSFGEAVRGNAIKDMEANNRLLEEGVDMYTDYNGQISELEAFLKLANKQLSTFGKETKKVSETQLEQLKKQLKDNNEQIEAFTKLTTDPNDPYLNKLKDRSREIQSNIDLLEKLISLEVEKTEYEKFLEKREKERKEAAEKANEEEKKQAEDRLDYLERTAEAIEKKDEEIQKKREEERQKEIEAIKKAEDKKVELYKATVSVLQDINNNRIEQIEDVIEAINTEQAVTAAKIEAGVDTYEDSLTKQNEARQKALADKRKLEKQQLLFEKTQAFLDTYRAILNSMENPDPTQAIIETLKAGATIQAASSSFIPSFDVGTDYVEGGNLDSQGGQLAKIHKGEGIFTKSEMDRFRSVGLDTREKITNAVFSNALRLDGNQDKSMNWIGGKEIINELKSMNKSLRNQPSHSVAYDNAAKTYASIEKTKYKTTINKYK